MKDSREPQNRSIQIYSTGFLAKVQKQLNGGRDNISTNSVGAIGNPQANTLNFDLNFIL